MRNPLDGFKRSMLEYQIYRNSELIATVKGLKNTEKGTSKKYIGFYPDTDIQISDIVKNPSSNVDYHIIDIDTASYLGKIFEIKAYYQTSISTENTKPTIYNINNPTNSIIGNQQSAILNNSNFTIEDLKQLIELYGNEDKQQLYELSSQLQECLSKDSLHKSKLSRFGNLISKHSWLPLAISQILAGWLQSH